MLNRIEEIALTLNAKSCPNCGKIDVAYGLINNNGEFGECLYCEARVQQYSQINTLLFALEVFENLVFRCSEIKAESFNKLIRESLNNLLIPLRQNKMPFSSDFMHFQNVINNFHNLALGGPDVGGYIKFENGEHTVVIFEDENSEAMVYGLFVNSAVIMYLQKLKFSDNDSTKKEAIEMKALSEYFETLVRKNKNIFGKPKSEVSQRLNSWFLKNPNSIVTHKIKNKIKIEVSELPSDLNMQTLADIYTLHQDLLNYPFKR